MNGYRLLAESYRKLANDGKITKEEAAKKCKALDFLSTCDKEDICNLFDSSAFNEIVIAYLHDALEHIGSIDAKQKRAIAESFYISIHGNSAKNITE